MPGTNWETLLRKDICHIICLTNVLVCHIFSYHFTRVSSNANSVSAIKANVSTCGRQGNIWANIENHEYFHDNVSPVTFGQGFSLVKYCVVPRSCELYVYICYLPAARSGWEKLCQRSWKRPEPEGRGTFWRPRAQIFSSGPTLPVNNVFIFCQM
jgi:hypothetical protein